MTNVLQMVENQQNSEFYPTPERIVEKMLQCVDLDKCHTILEPSAGKGDILRVIAQKAATRYGRYGGQKLDVDCIEIDPHLRQILKYNFSEERELELKYRKHDLEESRQYDRDLHKYLFKNPADRQEVQEIDAELLTFFQDGIHIVHDDFLTYTPFKRYDLIIMNPPFSNGDKHLLKALKMQSKGGKIVCLLNAETLRNPYTETRRELAKQLQAVNANVEFIENAFVSAERKTGVEIALISVSIEQAKEESDIYSHFKKAEEMEDTFETATELEVTDYIKAAISRFKVEVKSGLELIRQYRALVPYMLRSFEDKNSSPILRLTDSTDRGYDSVSVNDYLNAVRLKYWKALFSNPKFVGQMTSTLQEEYRGRVNAMQNYDFTEFNINLLAAEMGARVKQGVEDEIIKMFDRLTEEHSWFPECKKNRHLFDGWKTNKAHKIDKKVIIPCYGVFDSWDGKPRTYKVDHVLGDIERILNYLDGGMTQEVDSMAFLSSYFDRCETKNIPMKYFNATFYKKGTVHLVFTCPELIERFNIYAAQHKNWLPPDYGKKRYSNMTPEEKAVIDSFQGEKAYNEVMAKPGFYLAPVASNQVLMLNA
jgi:hypothetical protein